MESGPPLGGTWGLTILMVVIASWILYRFVAPKGWREWSRAGLIQAFIIALYAEMYGFPLTIYLLSGWLGISIPWVHENGHLWATLFGWGDTGAIVEMQIGYLVVFFGIWLLARGWREVYRATHKGELATDGVYAVVRHPQYTGIFFAIFGQLIHWPTLPTLALFPVIVWSYYRLARKEERAMLEKHGAAYAEYRSRVPMFFPSRGGWKRLLGPRAPGEQPTIPRGGEPLSEASPRRRRPAQGAQ